MLAAASRSQRILHVGCGGDSLPPWLTGDETRLDIDPNHKPHVVASMTQMGDIGSFDVVYTSHAIEHLYPHDVKRALQEFLRVLSPGGYALVIVPNCEGVQPTEDVLYISPSGPITGIDVLYGYRPVLESMPYMAHHTGFVRKTLAKAMLDAGFSGAEVRCDTHYNLIGVAIK